MAGSLKSDIGACGRVWVRVVGLTEDEVGTYDAKGGRGMMRKPI